MLRLRAYHAEVILDLLYLRYMASIDSSVHLDRDHRGRVLIIDA